MTRDYDDEINQWRAERLAALAAEDGWLNLTDRVEIAPGHYSVGSASQNDLVISVGPERLGVLELGADGRASLDHGDGAQFFEPVPDNPPRLAIGNLLLELTQVEGQFALRVRDRTDPRRTDFAGLSYFPVDPDWRIEAQWRPLAATLDLGIDLITGASDTVRVTHEALFARDGQEVRLIPTHWKSGKPMFVVRDRTAGRETYGAARFLFGEESGDTVVLDFNKAFSPPCAFTELAVCPLPPKQNVMPFEIRAGEKAPKQ